jgi:hypothetical protein
MLKRTLAIAFSAAFTTAMLAAPMAPAYAEMAAPTKETTKSKKEPAKKETKSEDKSGMSGADRRKKCSEEWKAAKDASKTGGKKWPQFYSECNTRLKGG